MPKRLYASRSVVDMISLGSPPENLITIDKMISSMEKRLEERIRDRLLVEQKKRIESKAWAYHLASYHNIIIRRLFQEWLKTRLGKDAKERATNALKDAYGGDVAFLSGDFVTETKTLLRRLHKAQEDGDVKAEMSILDKLKIIQKVAEEDFMPSLSGQGFLDILGAYGDANHAVHKGFSKSELQELCDEATSFTTSEASAWVVRFSQDLLLLS